MRCVECGEQTTRAQPCRRCRARKKNREYMRKKCGYKRVFKSRYQKDGNYG